MVRSAKSLITSCLVVIGVGTSCYGSNGFYDDYQSVIKNWHQLIEGVTSKISGCGMVYEIANPTSRVNEDFAIVDMRGISFSQPHYHINGETETYIVVQGSGVAVVGGREIDMQPGVTIVTPPYTAHYIVRAHDLVLAVVNTPSFNAANAVDVVSSDVIVGFDEHQFKKLTGRAD